jgi:transposase
LGIPADDSPTSADAHSLEELREENVALRSMVGDLKKMVDRLSVEVIELRARLGINSRNSSKPPSTDGYVKPAPKSRRTRSGKKPGKQPGDPGHHLAQRIDPDATSVHAPEACGRCGQGLGTATVTGVIRRQVFDLPPLSLFCLEHQVERRRCSCGAETTGDFPKEATAPTCYGPALRAYVCYLVTRQHIPIARVAELLRDTYGAPVSAGTIIAMVQEGAVMLGGFLEGVKDLLRESDVVHADESGLRVAARLHWAHVVSSTDLTLYHLDERRGTSAMETMGVLEHLSGVLVHDGWNAYRTYDNVSHALCNAHHLRELVAVSETEGQGWAADMAGLLAETWHLVLEAKGTGDSALALEVYCAIRSKYRAIIAAGYAVNPFPQGRTGKRGFIGRSKALNLLIRLDTYADDVLRFAGDFSVPFDNNLAERDIRMVRIAEKISGGFRSREGADAFLAFRSYLSTAAKQGAKPTRCHPAALQRGPLDARHLQRRPLSHILDTAWRYPNRRGPEQLPMLRTF